MKDTLFSFHKGNVADIYESWPQPDLIISDGAYGLRGFSGDTNSADALPEWYRPHIEMWSLLAKPSTCLWFWNTEIGWATIHPLLDLLGWDYVQTVVWDKGISHIAGNVNGKTIRQFPVVTEVSVLYRRRISLFDESGECLTAKEWLRHEWLRSGLPLYKANEACGVKNAATRKYLTQDWLWYWPPGEAVAAMAAYCNEHGLSKGAPYFSINHNNSVTAEEWDSLRSVWNHYNGITNVWSRPPLSDGERFKGSLKKSAPRTSKATAFSASHLNQKPLDLMEKQIMASSNEGDVIWEPFGGLASASVAAINLGRMPYTAEVNPEFQELAYSRLKDAERTKNGNASKI